MRPFTSKEIQDQFEKLPAELQEAISSPEIHDKIQLIGKKYTLLIDQVGELVDEIGLVLLGLAKSSDFVDHISTRLNISSKTALLIAQDVNQEIFDSIRQYIRASETSALKDVPDVQEEKGISSLERMGGFSVEKEAPESGGEVTAADRGDILAGLENPPASVPSHTGTPPANLPTDTRSATMPPAENHTEPLVDYLLSTPAGRSTQKVSVATPTTPATQKPLSPPVPQKPKNDPYKEAI